MENKEYLEPFEYLLIEELKLFRDTTVKLVDNQIITIREIEPAGN